MTEQVTVNGVNGNGINQDKETFLFTSESVGEGHPGKCSKIMLTVMYSSYLYMLHQISLLLNCSKYFSQQLFCPQTKFCTNIGNSIMYLFSEVIRVNPDNSEQPYFGLILTKFLCVNLLLLLIC